MDQNLRYLLHTVFPRYIASFCVIGFCMVAQLLRAQDTLSLFPVREVMPIQSETGANTNKSHSFGQQIKDSTHIRSSLMFFDLLPDFQHSQLDSLVFNTPAPTWNNHETLPMSLHMMQRAWWEAATQKDGAKLPLSEDEAAWLSDFFPDQLWKFAGDDFSPGPNSSATPPSTSQAYPLSASRLDSDKAVGFLVNEEESKKRQTTRTLPFLRKKKKKSALKPSLSLRWTTHTALSEAKPKLQMGVYPNPAQDNLRLIITPPYAEEMNVRLINLLGVNMHEQYVGPRTDAVELNWEMAHLPRGIYFVVIEFGQDRYSRRVILR